jgi:hypothetical protein
MKKGTEKSSSLSSWGVSLLNKLTSASRNKRKRDASKRRRKLGKREIYDQVHDE